MKKKLTSLFITLCTALMLFSPIKANAISYDSDSELTFKQQIQKDKEKQDIKTMIQQDYASNHEIVDYYGEKTINNYDFLQKCGLLGKTLYEYVSYAEYGNGNREDINDYFYDPDTGHLFRCNQGIWDCLDMDINLNNSNTILNDTFELTYKEAEDIVSKHLIRMKSYYPDRIRYSFKQFDGKYKILCENSIDQYNYKFKTISTFYVDKSTGSIYNELNQEILYE